MSAERNHSEALNNLQNQAGAVERLVVRIVNGMEDATLHHNKSELNWILKEVETVQTSIAVSRKNLIFANEHEQIHLFYDRVMAGWLEVDFHHLENLVISVGLETFGVHNSFIDFPKTEVMDSLKTVLEISELKISEKFVQLLEKVDKEIKEVYQMIFDGKVVPGKNANSINTDLNAIANLAVTAKSVLTAEYYPLRERLGSKGKRLDRLQEMNADRFIHGLYFVEHFVHEYADTLNKAIKNN